MHALKAVFVSGILSLFLLNLVQAVPCDQADLNADFAVNVLDIVSIATIFGLTSGDAGFIPARDFNTDSAIDILDLVQVASNVGCPVSCRDNDGDTYPDISCGGTDCNDANPAVNPGTPEVCTNSIDDNCNGMSGYDTQDGLPADPACPVSVTGISLAQRTPPSGGSITMTCSSSLAGVNSLKAGMTSACDFVSCSGSTANFSCVDTGSNTFTVTVWYPAAAPCTSSAWDTLASTLSPASCNITACSGRTANLSCRDTSGNSINLTLWDFLSSCTPIDYDRAAAALGEECNWQSWTGSIAEFSCATGPQGKKAAFCYINRSRSFNPGGEYMETLRVYPSACSAHTLQPPCDSDPNCDWCPRCSGSQYSGGLDRCVPAGGCLYSCDAGECSAVCDFDSVPCAATDCDNLDGCYSGTYRDYADAPNFCQPDCSCPAVACSAFTTSITDADGDGYDTECDNDCDDNPGSCGNACNPGAAEVCDGFDNDCDMQTDEGGVCGGQLYCDSCADCSSKLQSSAPGSAIILSQNIIDASGNCIVFGGADYKTFDCSGRTIDGPGRFSGIGIYLDYGSAYNIIRNCPNIVQFERGISMWSNSNYNVIENVSIRTTSDGFYIYSSSSHNTLRNIRISDCGANGMYLYQNENNTLENISLSGSLRGIQLHSSMNNTLRNIEASANTYDGIYFMASSYNRLTNITASGNQNYGLNFESECLDNAVNNSAISFNTLGGIRLRVISGVPYYPRFNAFYNNRFNNTFNAVLNSGLPSPNYFNTSLKSGINIVGGGFIGGNFWDDPSGGGYSRTCTDSASPMGICDSGYTISGSYSWAVDNLPLSSGRITLCNSCSDCNSKIAAALPGETIQLSADILNYGSTSTENDLTQGCIAFNGKDDVTFDCNGHMIQGNGDLYGYGIWLMENNGGSLRNTVRNCDSISRFYEGIHIISGSENNFINNQLHNNYFGLYSWSSPGNSYSDLVLRDNEWYGSFSEDSPSNVFSDTVLENNTFGFYLWTGSDNNIVRNMECTESDTGIYFRSDGNTFENIHSYNHNQPGLAGTAMWFEDGSGNKITNYLAHDNNGDGLSFHGHNNTLNNITTYNNGNYGISIVSDSNNNVLNGVFSYNNSYETFSYSGISIIGASNNTFNNVASYDNEDKGIYLMNCSNNRFTELKVNNSKEDYGIFLYASSNNIFTNVATNDNYWDGMILMTGSSNNTLFNVRSFSNNNGLYLSNSSGNLITNLSSFGNLGHGIYVIYSDFNRINNSRIYSNGYSGIYFREYPGDYPTGNLIFNSVLNNTYNLRSTDLMNTNLLSRTLTCSSGPNIAGGPCIGGNVWSDPDGNFSDTCTDSDSNGICDSSYTPAVSNTDLLPISSCGAGGCGSLTTSAAQVADITPRAFSVSWVASRPSGGSLRLFMDSSGTTPCSTCIISDVSYPNTNLASGVIQVQTSNLAIDTTYYYQRVTTSGAETLYEPSGPPYPAAHTMESSGIVDNDVIAHRVLQSDGSTPASGALIIATVAGSYPVSGWVGEYISLPYAYVDLNNVYSQSNNISRELSGGESITIESIGGSMGHRTYSGSVPPETGGFQTLQPPPSDEGCTLQ